jgi:hypothetical protein
MVFLATWSGTHINNAAVKPKLNPMHQLAPRRCRRTESRDQFVVGGDEVFAWLWSRLSLIFYI